MGRVVLAHGFRPFFLLAAFWSALAMGLWLGELGGQIDASGLLPPVTWHAHEMLFGFTMAAVAGFLLTAVPNWTGRGPLRGRPLLGLVLLWLAGRIAIPASATIGGWLAAAIDLAFPLALCLLVLRELVSAGNRRNVPIALALGLLVVADALMHAEVLGFSVPVGCGARLAVAVVTLLIALIGGRIVPAFTRNWLTRQGVGEPALPAPFGVFDGASLAGTALALLAWVVVPESAPTAWLATIAAVLCAARLARWHGWRTTADPLVFVLHVGWAWLPAGLTLLALAYAVPDLMSGTAALHAFTAGAFGTMILAVMTRATLGHTGRALHAGPGTVAAYGAVGVAGMARVAMGFIPDASGGLLWLSGLAWVVAFTVYVVIYGPFLLRPRVDGRPG